MNDESSSERRGTPLWIVIGFLLAFGATVVTVVLTGLFVRAPASSAAHEDAPSAQIEREAPVQ